MTRAEEIVALLDPIQRAIREEICRWKTDGGKAVNALKRIDDVTNDVRESIASALTEPEAPRP